MSDRRNIDPEEAAEVTRRIGQAFDFAQDVIDDPSVLQQIPDVDTPFWWCRRRWSSRSLDRVAPLWHRPGMDGPRDRLLRTGGSIVGAKGSASPRFGSRGDRRHRRSGSGGAGIPIPPFWHGDQAIEALHSLADFFARAPHDRSFPAKRRVL
jgi:hypothetical protein